MEHQSLRDNRVLPPAIAALLQIQRPQAAQSQAPLRDVADPGVVATGQHISPAGVQSVFGGRVAGVRFGRSSDEIWVAAPGSTYRLDWRANRAIARVQVNGTPGGFCVAI